MMFFKELHPIKRGGELKERSTGIDGGTRAERIWKPAWKVHLVVPKKDC